MPAELMPGSVQETMIMCFLDRARFSARFPTVLQDAKAAAILEQFPDLLHTRATRDQEMPGLTILLRSRYFDDAVRDFLTTHPRATIICLASGLETNYFRVDNGQLQWWDVDLPDAIDFRRRIIPESERNRYVAADVLDLSWCGEIKHDPSDGVMIVASGIMCYFTRREIGALVRGLADHFPGAELVLEYYSKPVMWGNNLFFRIKGMSARLVFGAVNLSGLMRRDTGRIEVIERAPYYSRDLLDVKLKLSTRFSARASNVMRLMEFMRWKLR